MNKKAEYDKIDAKSMLYTIEFVCAIGEPGQDETLQQALEELQGIGTADIVARTPIVQTLNEATAIMHERSLRGKHS